MNENSDSGFLIASSEWNSINPCCSDSGAPKNLTIKLWPFHGRPLVSERTVLKNPPLPAHHVTRPNISVMTPVSIGERTIPDTAPTT